MTFFNKKEEVIQVELTQYGKYLLSKGKLKAKYYEFFDDDVLYDSEYGGITENNSETGERIRNETPSLKTQHVFSGIETGIKKAVNLKRSKKPSDSDKNLQQTPEKHYLSSPLGNSDLGTEYAPSWKISALKGNFENINTYQSDYHQMLFTPEIKVKNITFTAVDDVDTQLSGAVFGDHEDQGIGTVSDLNLASTRFSDGTYVKIKDDFLLLDISELHTDSQKTNFDIEVFVEETNSITKQKELVPLFFKKKISTIKNNILLDQDSLPEDEIVDINDSRFVEHFFNVYVDGEIASNILCAYLPENEKEYAFNNGELDCSDYKKVSAENLYDTDAQPEKDCD